MEVLKVRLIIQLQITHSNQKKLQWKYSIEIIKKLQFLMILTLSGIIQLGYNNIQHKGFIIKILPLFL